jgi:DNA-directed RNA polymerase specialized sigma24 family protein
MLFDDPEATVDLWRWYKRATDGTDPKVVRAVEMKVEGYTYAEIAAALGRNPRMVPRYVAHLRERLQGCSAVAL